jgi:hypothetical protein
MLHRSPPCRRKKAKCSGERPVCGHCQRLAQDCQWESASGSRSNIPSDQQDSVGVRAVSISTNGKGTGSGSGIDQGNTKYDVSNRVLLAGDRESAYIFVTGWLVCASRHNRVKIGPVGEHDKHVRPPILAGRLQELCSFYRRFLPALINQRGAELLPSPGDSIRRTETPKGRASPASDANGAFDPDA